MDEVPKLLKVAETNYFMLSLGVIVPDIKRSRNKKNIITLPKGLIFDMKKAFREGIFIQPIEYFSNPDFNCYHGKQNSLSINPKMELIYCFKTMISSGINIEQFDKDLYQTYLVGLRKQISKCNPFCSSNCAYMGTYLKEHPTHLFRIGVRTLYDTFIRK